MLLALLVLVAAFAILTYVLHRLTMIPAVNFNSAGSKRFHSERYAPLSRLLSQDDADLLIRSGIPVKAIRAFRAGRREVFRIYLRHLRADFSRLQQTGKLMILHSEVDRPDLAQALLRQNVAFRLALLRVESRLLLHALGLSGVDGDALLGPLESLSNAMYPFVSDSSMPTAA